MAERRTIYFLHELGYNFFDIGRLTYREINYLIEAYNRKTKEENDAYKRMRKR